MLISIIIPSFNKKELTKSCLKALKINTPEEYLNDVLVIDNGSDDGTKEYLETIGWIKKVLNNKNLGFSKACNQGAKKARGEILIFLNNDTEVQSGWIEPLTSTIKEGAAIAGSKLLFPDGKLQHAGIVFSSDLIPRHIYYRENPNKKYVNIKREYQAVTGACLAINKDDYWAVGGFSEKYVNGLEDIDLCLKVKELGKKIYYCPESVIIHHESVSEGRFKHVDLNERIFLKSWREKIKPDEIDYYKLDKRSGLFIKNQEIKRVLMVNKENLKTKSPLFKVARIFYITIYRLYKTFSLIINLDIKNLFFKIKKVIKNAKS